MLWLEVSRHPAHGAGERASSAQPRSAGWGDLWLLGGRSKANADIATTLSEGRPVAEAARLRTE